MGLSFRGGRSNANPAGLVAGTLVGGAGIMPALKLSFPAGIAGAAAGLSATTGVGVASETATMPGRSGVSPEGAAGCSRADGGTGAEDPMKTKLSVE